MKLPPNLRTISNQNSGFTLIEVILVIVVLAIAFPPIINLLSSVLENSNKSLIISKATIFAEEKMEGIIADKRNPLRGFSWVIAPGRYSMDTPEEGFSRNVVIATVGKIHNGISFAEVEVKISHADIPDFELKTWLIDY